MGSVQKLDQLGLSFQFQSLLCQIPFSMSVLYSSILQGRFFLPNKLEKIQYYITCLFAGFYVTSFARALASAHT